MEFFDIIRKNISERCLGRFSKVKLVQNGGKIIKNGGFRLKYGVKRGVFAIKCVSALHIRVNIFAKLLIFQTLIKKIYAIK